MTVQSRTLTTPIGDLTLFAHEGRLCAVAFTGQAEPTRAHLRKRFGAFAEGGDFPAELTAAVERYFAGDLHAIDAIEVELGGTDFQRDVWAALRAIPAGQTISYSELARRVGRPRAVRAVGLANGQNPVPVVVPCHRVIAANGTLWGYGGGLDLKEWLLRHERALPVGDGGRRQLDLAFTGPVRREGMK